MKSEIVMHKGFLFPVPTPEIIIRIPNTRKIDHISIEELETAMLLVASKRIGSTKVSLIQEMTRIYGFNRVGEKIRIAMNKAYAQLQINGKIEEIEGKVVVL
ncbi:hypothetical protein M2150_001045 [Lachnospiraceae bacterium PM6-15]|uniref:hypothetical protein n=1 Tax=Ohessyouella blattaphilus TaxID=2949333 RepID=UPI003E28338C